MIPNLQFAKQATATSFMAALALSMALGAAPFAMAEDITPMDPYAPADQGSADTMIQSSSPAATEAMPNEMEAAPLLKADTSKQELGDSSMLLRSLALDVSGYPQADSLATACQAAEPALAFISATDDLALHMEAIRQAYMNFGGDAGQRQTFMDGLNSRYQASNTDPKTYFDFGYAELVFDANKNGLFFLRKANDNLALPYTSLAYALAQIDADRFFDHASPQDINQRKLDVGYKLKDALLFNKSDPQPNLWENYNRILDELKSFPAYDSLRRQDVTLMLVPYGSTTLGAIGADSQAMENAGTTFDPASVSCDPSRTSADIKNLVRSRTADLNGDGMNDSVNFFQQGTGQPYLVQLQDGKTHEIMADLPSYVTSVVEDLEGDGKKEVVVRQFEIDRRHPLAVYRWNGQCFVKDTHIARMFE
ncbi:MAG: hypothetical protein KC474_08135 [Cyanobacteria bacterium HKST-UBA04]|nr:hypothetical protein [Cyanobacteria bacterium HKST-UBA04]MCA9841151.1 hypothetical protein [Cyanobacteria bacterium HKST-UBA03]